MRSKGAAAAAACGDYDAGGAGLAEDGPLVKALSKQGWDRWVELCVVDHAEPWTILQSKADDRKLVGPCHSGPPDASSSSSGRSLSSVIYLTADSPDTLQSVEPGCTYVVGGLVDHKDKPGMSYERARKFGLRTARLPIERYARMRGRQPGVVVGGGLGKDAAASPASGVDVTTLCVVQMLLLFREHGNWGDAISRCPAMHCAPLRKYVRWLPPYEEFNDLNEQGNAGRPGAGFNLVGKPLAAPPKAKAKSVVKQGTA
jgi:hypothetical protein